MLLNSGEIPFLQNILCVSSISLNTYLIMLQFIAEINDNYSIPEQVQMALEGGCKWILLNVPLMSDGEIRELAREIIPLCMENEAMLTIIDHVEMAKELAIHGTLMHEGEFSVAQAREFCGPEAIIGVIIDKPEDLQHLIKADVDFAAFTRDTPVSRLGDFVKDIRNTGNMTPLVAFGDYSIESLESVLATGVNGLALAQTITNSSDPVMTVKGIISELK